jgi:hypothetical protein
MSHNTAHFAALMTKYNIDRDDIITIGGTGYLDKPVDGRLFQGHDAHGRAFVNLPITVTASTQALESYLHNWKDGSWRETAFTVFQRYSNRDVVFAIGGQLPPMSVWNFLGNEVNDLTTLDALLGNKTLRFHFDEARNPDNWIEITLRRPAAVSLAA